MCRPPSRTWWSGLSRRTRRSARRAPATWEEQSRRLTIAPVAPRRFVRWRKFRRKRGAFFGTMAAAVVIVLAAVAWVGFFRAGDTIDSLAVLPLVNQSGDPDQDYFVAGMTEELNSKLQMITSLQVKPSQSTARYKDTNKSPSEIAGELGVDAIVTGSVWLSGDRVRTSVRLIDARKEEVIWSDDQNFKMTDIFTAQRDVALNIAHAVRAALSPEEMERLDVPMTQNMEAHDLFMRGITTQGDTDEGIRTAIGYLERAVALDPGFAQAYFEMAWRYAGITIYGHESPAVAYPKAQELLDKALELNPEIPEARAFEGFLKEYWEWDYRGAEEALRKAIELTPRNAPNHSRYAFFLMKQSRCDEAAAEILRAAELEPRSEGIQQNVGEILYYCRRYEESAEASRIAIEMNPNHEQAHLFLGAALHELGRHEEAVAAVNRSRSGIKKSEIDSWIGVTYGLMGMETEAREVLAELQQRSADKQVSRFSIAVIYFSLGENDAGFEWLERALEAHDFRIQWLCIHQVFDPVRNDPRYIEGLARLKLSCL